MTVLDTDRGMKPDSGSGKAPSTARHGKSFKCPWPSAQRSMWSELRRWPFEKRQPIKGMNKAIKVITPSFVKALPRSTPDSLQPDSPADLVRSTWLGHASVLVQFKNAANPSSSSDVNILFDPMFTERASPFSRFGPQRRLPAPCKVADLPMIDAVCISHNHYDHLDVHTIAKLVKFDKTGNTIFFVPLGCGRILLKAQVPLRHIVEKDWWEEEKICFGPDRSIRITCTPAQHNSSRKLVDMNKSLWCSWVVQHEQMILETADRRRDSGTAIESEKIDVKPVEKRQIISSIFFGGDTGYRSSSEGPVCPAYKEIGSKFGPFDLAFVPIWRGAVLSGLSSLGFRLKADAWVRRNHCTPQDAVDVHLDVQARTSVGIHHSTFVGDDEAAWSIQLLKEACDRSDSHAVQFQRGGSKRKGKKGRNSGRFVVLDVGGSIAV